MSKKKKRLVDQNIIEALKKLPNPIMDFRHGLLIFIDDNRARSNQTRFEHISINNHELTIRDIENIPEGILYPYKYRIDKTHENTFNYYIKRKGKLKGFIKVSIKINKHKNHAKVKTIFITRIIK